MSENKQWHFYIGQSLRTMRPSLIPSLHTNLPILVSDNKIVPSWESSKHMNNLHTLYQAETFTVCRIQLTGYYTAKELQDDYIQQFLHFSPPQPFINNKCAHVDAAGLSSTTPLPYLHHHNKITPNDKSIWDRAHLNEYLGLTEDTGTWKYIT